MSADIGPLVVIPCLNEERHLPATLGQLLAQEAPAGALIVVVDGGSTDATVRIAEDFSALHPQLRVIHNPSRIQAAAVNLAVRRFGAGRRWLVRLDAHCEYPCGYIAGLVAAAEAADCEEVVVPMVSRARSGRCFQAASAAAQNSRLGTGGALHRHVGRGQYVDHGHHALFLLRAFAAAGGYDETFSHNEDAELDCRLAKAGGRAWLEPRLAVIYYPRSSVRALFKQYFEYGRGRARTIARHRTRPKLRQLAPLVVAPAVVLALAALILTPLLPTVRLALAAPAILWAAGVSIAGAGLGFAAGGRCGAFSGVAAMTMHMAWSLGFWRQALTGSSAAATPSPLVVEAARPPAL